MAAGNELFRAVRSQPVMRLTVCAANAIVTGESLQKITSELTKMTSANTASHPTCDATGVGGLETLGEALAHSFMLVSS